MSNLQRLTKWLLAAVLLAPTLVMAHGAVDKPIARQVYCKTLPDFWSGSPSDNGCAALSAKSGQYPGQQWNEVAHLIKAPGYNDPEIVKREVPDGQLCSAADSKKDGLNIVSDDWHRTDVTPSNGMMDVRIIGTAPHVPSFVKVFLTKPGFDPTQSPLTWNDLTLIHSEQFSVAQTNWGNDPPTISGASGYFKFPVPIPSTQTGKATLFVQWQRIDPAGEGFYNCSDINLIGAGIPEQWVNLGQFIDSIMNTLKAGDSVHFRILDNSPAAKEVVDITLPISANNLDPNIWGKQLADRINPTIAKVGEKKGNTIVFNPTDSSANSVYTTAKGYSRAMAIIAGEDPGPVNPAQPVARITGPSTLKSGQSFTFSGAGSSGSNGPLLYLWTVPGMVGAQNGATVSGTAYTVTQETKFTAQLKVRDQQNGKTDQAEVAFTVMPPGGGEEYPAYKEGTPYKAGDIVSNNGKNYKCKPHPYTAWCAGAAWAYAPGTGTAWDQAWEEAQ
ncbi:lytic polysaccharide monooxygenase [Pseudomonas azotoformans]|jgi:chitin-binding protein|uniref:lytic polysaccharide monooxygenase n=1 Tax=Pseudomonas azotoformans TaxID=47878 RepID=UPI001146527A|nr:lytic polysaccharide monooxygenase [Pseudomonas azotoformans]QDH68019.1 chitin-binding protein [Pseudomonas azotoformans]